ncbi:Protein of unknown function [Thermobacillus xylanilyticus]|uniref:Transposase n=1 Tax=Thermobacillus xylanilyticus TaxID=76633 RepID=A0ABN7RPI1_THEXY|nr:Protein of unknown function [Thermobacillus xylanilyticus]
MVRAVTRADSCYNGSNETGKVRYP